MAAWRPQNRSNRKKSKKVMGVLPKGILTPSFIEITMAVTKRALLKDDGDGWQKMPRHCYSSPEVSKKQTFN
jgi:hypothetical protein